MRRSTGRPDGRLPAMEVDVHEPAARPEEPGEAPEVARAAREVVVGVHHEDEVARAVRQERIVVAPQHGRDVDDPRAAESIDQDRQHPRLRVDGIDAPPPPDRPREPPHEVPGARADLGDRLAPPEAEGANELRGALPSRARRILEPAQHELEVPRVPVRAEAARHAGAVRVGTGPLVSARVCHRSVSDPGRQPAAPPEPRDVAARVAPEVPAETGQ